MIRRCPVCSLSWMNQLGLAWLHELFGSATPRIRVTYFSHDHVTYLVLDSPSESIPKLPGRQNSIVQLLQGFSLRCISPQRFSSKDGKDITKKDTVSP